MVVHTGMHLEIVLDPADTIRSELSHGRTPPRDQEVQRMSEPTRCRERDPRMLAWKQQQIHGG